MPSLAALGEFCRSNVLLSEYTWYRLGGPARWFVEPRTESDLALAIRACVEERVPWRVLGRGANVLVRDEGFPGAVICLRGESWEFVEFDDRGVLAGAGADFPRLVKSSAARGLAGLEKLAGIPGTLGGIVRMNAGGKYGSVGEFVREARVLDASGAILVRTNREIGFRYRHTDLAGCIVLRVRLDLESGDPATLSHRAREIWNEKYRTQPPLSERTSGCVFKNPPGAHAGALIDRAGLKGHRSGAAEISARHANFVVAHPGATAADVLNLIRFAQKRVRQDAGVDLELEVEIW